MSRRRRGERTGASRRALLTLPPGFIGFHSFLKRRVLSRGSLRPVAAPTTERWDPEAPEGRRELPALGAPEVHVPENGAPSGPARSRGRARRVSTGHPAPSESARHPLHRTSQWGTTPAVPPTRCLGPAECQSGPPAGFPMGIPWPPAAILKLIP